MAHIQLQSAVTCRRSLEESVYHLSLSESLSETCTQLICCILLLPVPGITKIPAPGSNKGTPPIRLLKSLLEIDTKETNLPILLDQLSNPDTTNLVTGLLYDGNAHCPEVIIREIPCGHLAAIGRRYSIAPYHPSSENDRSLLSWREMCQHWSTIYVNISLVFGAMFALGLQFQQIVRTTQLGTWTLVWREVLLPVSHTLFLFSLHHAHPSLCYQQKPSCSLSNTTNHRTAVARTPRTPKPQAF